MQYADWLRTDTLRVDTKLFVFVSVFVFFSVFFRFFFSFFHFIVFWFILFYFIYFRINTFTFVQIGAGHGKFTCLVLQHLLEMREFLPTLCQSEQASGGVPDERGGDADAETCETDETLEGGGSGGGGGGGGAGKGVANGLPFRYVMTDVAQVCKRV